METKKDASISNKNEDTYLSRAYALEQYLLEIRESIENNDIESTKNTLDTMLGVLSCVTQKTAQ